MVNDLSVSVDTVKFVDDTTIWEIIRKSQRFSSEAEPQKTKENLLYSNNHQRSQNNLANLGGHHLQGPQMDITRRLYMQESCKAIVRFAPTEKMFNSYRKTSSRIYYLHQTSFGILVRSLALFPASIFK